VVLWPLWWCDLCGGVILVVNIWEPPIVVEFASNLWPSWSLLRSLQLSYRSHPKLVPQDWEKNLRLVERAHGYIVWKFQIFSPCPKKNMQVSPKKYWGHVSRNTASNGDRTTWPLVKQSTRQNPDSSWQINYFQLFATPSSTARVFWFQNIAAHNLPFKKSWRLTSFAGSQMFALGRKYIFNFLAAPKFAARCFISKNLPPCLF
jgi:hypothetical protein